MNKHMVLSQTSEDAYQTESVAADTALEQILAASGETPPETAAVQPTAGNGLVFGRLVRIDSEGRPWVDFPANPDSDPRVARSTVALPDAAGEPEVALMFEAGDLTSPVIVGLLQPTQPLPTETAQTGESPSVSAEVDGDRLVLTANKEITLRCGKASITLTRAGKVLIRGAYLLSRSSGANRIKGGSVQIN